METKHTPGPWRSDYDDNGFYVVLADKAPSPYIVATGGEGDENEANARLIAAAPDLLDALINLKSVALDVFSTVGPQFEAIEKAQAALVKAGDPTAIREEVEWKRFGLDEATGAA